LTVTDDGRILFKTYPLAETGKEVLREMIPIFGFDLPAQTGATTSVKVSRTIQSYPFASAADGTTRVHKFVIRYTDDLPTTTSSEWEVATSTGAYPTFYISGCDDSSMASGTVAIATTTIPTDTTAWWLNVNIPSAQSGKKIKVFQIFLAAYDQVD